VDEIVGRSDGQIGYVGEWHSHPDGYTTEPSEDDRTVFRWLDDHMVRDGRPPVMLIAGEKDFRFFLGSMDASVVLKRTDARTPESSHQMN
jgi:Prokaryotic homologs of the JAB domain